MKNSKAQGLGALFISTALSKVMLFIGTLASGVVVARVLDPVGRAEYGLVVLVGGFVGILGSFSYFDGSILIGRSRALCYKKVLSSMAVFSLVICGSVLFIVLVGYAKFSDLFNVSMGAAMPLTLYSITVVLYLLVKALGSVRLELTIVNLAECVVSALFVFIVFYSEGALHGLDAGDVILLLVFARFAVFCVALFFQLRKSLSDISRVFVLDSIRAGLILYPADVLEFLNKQSDRLLGAIFWSSEILGLYFVAFSAVGAGYSLVVSVLGMVLLPYFSGQEGDDRRGSIQTACRFSNAASVLMFLSGIFLLPFFIPALYGSDYLGSVGLGLQLLLAFFLLPARKVVLESVRSLGRGAVHIYMAVVSIFSIALVSFSLGPDSPTSVIVGLAASNAISFALGLRYLHKHGVVDWKECLFINANDFAVIKNILGVGGH